MNKVILVSPNIGLYKSILKPFLPLPLLSISRYLVDECDVKIIDQQVNNNWKKELKKELTKDVICVGVTSMTGMQIKHALEISRFVKENSDVPVVWGGVHASIMPYQTLNNSYIDFVVKGEGELTFYELVKQLSRNRKFGNIRGLWYKEKDKIKSNKDRAFVDLNKLPPLPYDLINIKDYIHKLYSHDKMIEIETSRGCPYRCSFCYNSVYNKSKWRAFNAKNVVNHLKTIKDKYNVRSFHIIDDVILINKKRSFEICNMINKEKLDVELNLQGVRADVLLKYGIESIKLLEKSGVRSMRIGVESGSERILRLLQKGITVNQVLKLNSLLKKFKYIEPHYNFMCGFPTETKKDLFMSCKLIIKLIKNNKNACVSWLYLYKPYPGTELYKKALEHGFRPPRTLEDWAKFDWTIMSNPWASKKLKELYIKAIVCSTFVDKKLGLRGELRFLEFLGKMYRPIARYRMKNNFYKLMPESYLAKMFSGN